MFSVLESPLLDDDNKQMDRSYVNEDDHGKTHDTFKYALNTQCNKSVDLLECMQKGTNNLYYYPCDIKKYITCSPSNVFYIMPCPPGTVFNLIKKKCGKCNLIQKFNYKLKH